MLSDWANDFRNALIYIETFGHDTSMYVFAIGDGAIIFSNILLEQCSLLLLFLQGFNCQEKL